MKQEIQVVTSFFNIKRADWGTFRRSEQLYLEYFKVWAKIKNNLVVYVQTEEMKKDIEAFRAGLGLHEKTKVIIIKEFETLDQELYSSIKRATENPVQQGARLLPKNPEVWSADYNYVMLLKMWCVRDAIQKGYASGMVAWVDFGYDHGGAVLDKNSDFNFKWEYDFPDKINLFLIQELDDRPIFDIVCSMDTYVMGTVIIGADHLWDDFWQLMRQSMISLNDCGLTDDDQNIILMSYRKRPDIFATHLSDWQMQMKQFGGEHLRVVSVQESSCKKLARKIYRKLRYTKDNYKLSRRIFKYLSEKELH